MDRKPLRLKIGQRNKENEKKNVDDWICHQLFQAYKNVDKEEAAKQRVMIEAP